jgi:DNA-binding transcriptional regulator YiaG
MKKYQGEALKVIHQDAEGLHRLGIISDIEMREYDHDCLIQEPEIAQTVSKGEALYRPHGNQNDIFVN